jgi:homospermidine synthase
LKVALTKENFKQILDNIFVDNNSFCVNVSVGTSSFDIMTYCQEKDIFYIDTVKEEWEGFYSDSNLSIGERTNYALR